MYSDATPTNNKKTTAKINAVSSHCVLTSIRDSAKELLTKPRSGFTKAN
jgi:hypothetical protein